jgi:hypothetical protein
MTLVRKKIPPKASNTIPKVPEIVPVKYSIAITTATTTRSILSSVPMFVFIVFFLVCGTKVFQQAGNNQQLMLHIAQQLDLITV